MSLGLQIVVTIVALALGAGVTYLVLQTMAKRRVGAAEKEADRLVAEAKTKVKEMLLEAKEEAIRARAATETEYRDRRNELQRLERRLSQKEENLERKSDGLERRIQQLSLKENENETVRASIDDLKHKQVQQLELISGMSSSEARDYLLREMEQEVREEGARRVREMEKWSQEQGMEKAREIVVQAIQRYAADVVSETTVSVVALPSDEMKGRLIGREGRNIRALEAATGVDLIIDDTPEAVTVSSFDPVRRQVAKLALEKLIMDGRIHPARIEEIVVKAKAEVDANIRSEGERAAYETAVPGLHPELIRLLGRLKYRYSYGQNALQHSIEVAHLAGMMAAELGANVEVAKKGGLLHDIGKAVDHEVKGPHALIGMDLIKQWDKSQDVWQAVSEHHGEAGTTSVAGFIVSAADAISGSRPGARRESLDQYLKRLEALESIANSFEGVEKSYAIQAGREIRILVKPDSVDDLAAMRLVRDIVRKIEETVQYPGQIKVTVIRETRAVDYAK